MQDEIIELFKFILIWAVTTTFTNKINLFNISSYTWNSFYKLNDEQL